jgi:hypothetical protein
VKGRAIKHHDCAGGGWRDTAVVVHKENNKYPVFLVTATKPS